MNDSISAFSPARPYDPENGQVNLETKICRHLRRKGWKFNRAHEKWVDPRTSLFHTFSAAISIQLQREERK